MNVFPHFPVKCFHSKFTGSKVLCNSSFPRLDSRSLLVPRCIRDLFVCLFMFPSSLSSSSPLTSVRSIGSSFLPVFLLSYLSQFLCSFPLRHRRVHNCITERLFSQLTLFLLLTPILSHSPSRSVLICRSQSRIVSLVHIYSRKTRRLQRRWTSR